MKQDKPKTYKKLATALEALKEGEECVKTPKGYVNIKTWPKFKEPWKFNPYMFILCTLICATIGGIFANSVGFCIGWFVSVIGYPILWKWKYG